MASSAIIADSTRPAAGSGTFAATLAAGAKPARPAQATPAPANASTGWDAFVPASAAALPRIDVPVASAPTAAHPGSPPPPLQQQLAQPVLTLARSENGDHTIVVQVAPDDLGPVTVHARVGEAGVRIELFAPNDAGREAIRQILPELRRDVNGAAGNGSVTVSDQNAPGADSSGREHTPAPQPDTGRDRASRDRIEEAAVLLPDRLPSAPASVHALDITV